MKNIRAFSEHHQKRLFESVRGRPDTCAHVLASANDLGYVGTCCSELMSTIHSLKAACEQLPLGSRVYGLGGWLLNIIKSSVERHMKRLFEIDRIG